MHSCIALQVLREQTNHEHATYSTYHIGECVEGLFHFSFYRYHANFRTVPLPRPLHLHTNAQ